MQIDILCAPNFTTLNIEAERGHKNAGGGMACLINSIRACLLTKWDVNICTDISEVKAPVVIIDACWFSLPHIQDKTKIESEKERMNKYFEWRSANPESSSVLLCAEKTIFRWLPSTRKSLVENVNALGVTCPYLWDLLKTNDIVPTLYLCDAINPDLFRPAKKEMTVTAVGALKYIKNIDFICDVFERLEGKMHRTYLGSAELWGHDKPIADRGLADKVKQCTEQHIPNASPVEVAYRNSTAAFAINDTWHDCSSRSNEELLMSGVISIHGQHPLFQDRPGFTVKNPEEAVAIIAELTNNFQELPPPKLHQEARDWAVEHASTDTFVRQFETLIRMFI